MDKELEIEEFLNQYIMPRKVLDEIKELQNKVCLLNKMNEENYEKYCNELKKNNQLQSVYELEHESTLKAQILEEKIQLAIDKLYCWGEVLDAKFQQEMLEILGSSDNNEVS